MKPLFSLMGGLGGALSVMLLQELIKRVDPGAPRLDLLRKQAAGRLLKKAGGKAVSGLPLNAASLAGDILLNTLYYSLGGLRARRPVVAGGIMGLGMGLSAIVLPALLGLDKGYSAGTAKRKALTMGMFVAGGMVSALLSNRLEKKPAVRPLFHHNGSHKEVLDITV